MTETGLKDPTGGPPAYALELQAVYGKPSQTGFGSAVFFDQATQCTDLGTAAQARYRYFVGPSWERFGEEAWMAPWREVYRRPPGGAHEVVAELRSIADPDAVSSVSMILDMEEGTQRALAALAAAFDDPAVAELAAYRLGDGGAYSGILVAGCRLSGAVTEATFLVFLVD